MGRRRERIHFIGCIYEDAKQDSGLLRYAVVGMPGNTQTLKTIQERTAKLSGLFLGAVRVQVPAPRASREASAETNLVRVAALAK